MTVEGRTFLDSGLTMTARPHRPKPQPQPWHMVFLDGETVAAFARCKDAVSYAAGVKGAEVRPVDLIFTRN